MPKPQSSASLKKEINVILVRQKWLTIANVFLAAAVLYLFVAG